MEGRGEEEGGEGRGGRREVRSVCYRISFWEGSCV